MASPGTAAAVLDGIRVLDLSWGAAGPMATMLLADHGAAVTRIERPGGEPFDDVLDGYRVWHCGKRSAVLDLKDQGDLARFRALVAQSDILIESFAPGVTARLGIAYADLKEINPRLIYCSITGYGRENRHSGRPAFDALVAARTGLQWEARGWDGGPINRILGRDRPPSDFPPVPDALRIGSDRLGPIFTATPAPSVTTAHLAVIGISAALLARESTGVGQHVETSMLQAAILFSGCSWQRPEHPDAPGYQMAALDRRQNWGMVQAADRWMCFWTSPPEWAKAAGEGGILRVPDPSVVEERMKARALATGRARRMVGVDKQLEHLAEAAPIFAQFPAADWTRTAAEAGVALQPVRTPEEALTDPAFVADGSVAELVDPDIGVVRQAGILFRLRDRPTTVRTSSPNRGEHTAELRAEAERIATPRQTAQPSGKALPRGPLDGISVVDIGLAVAGPWCAQILADLGADVVKVDPSRQGFWFPTHMSVGVNRSKRSIHLDMKHPEGLKAVRKLIDRADVVVHNMRIGAAERLKVDYETVRQTNPRLVYCHTRGFEDGPRAHLPGHDQAGNALGGTEWEDGGCWDGGRPYFSALSGGDLGNGFFGASAVILALWDRARTGKGQAVDTSIVNASLFNNSRIYSTPDGRHFDRPTLDAGQFGLSALYRLYSCSQGWLCIAVLSDAHWAALVKAVPILDGDMRFATVADRRRHDLELAEILSTVFSTNTADQWFGRLDDCSVPCEVSSDRFSRDLFDDADLRALKWITTCETEALGRIDMFGNGIDFSATPASPGGPPPTLGQHTGEVLRDLGYTEAEVAALHASGAVNCAERPS